jgi:hypothetical protein
VTVVVDDHLLLRLLARTAPSVVTEELRSGAVYTSGCWYYPSLGRWPARTLVPVMAALRVRRQLNLLNAEALAVALLTSGVLVVSTDSPLLRSGALDVGFVYQVL